tara:strand:- start:199 stop:552 length:354 start_codon:yes stop_codon:yes gene_type:complete
MTKPNSPWHLTQIQRDEIVALLKQEKPYFTLQAIADKFGITKGTVHQYAKKENIVRSRSNTKYVTEDEVIEIVNAAVAKAIQALTSKSTKQRKQSLVINNQVVSRLVSPEKDERNDL